MSEVQDLVTMVQCQSMTMARLIRPCVGTLVCGMGSGMRPYEGWVPAKQAGAVSVTARRQLFTKLAEQLKSVQAGDLDSWNNGMK